jgi:hypothetical protein
MVDADGTLPAADAVDFAAGGVLPSGSLQFEPGETTNFITVNVTGDTVYESAGLPENFTVRLVEPSTGATIVTDTADGHIRDDDAALLAIAPASANKAEGNSGSTPFTFTVTRGGGGTGATTVNWSVNPGSSPSADANDFGGIFPSGTLTFSPTETAKTVTVNVSGDTHYEGGGAPENFLVTLTNASGGASITTPTATGQIQNDDTAATLSIAPVNADQAEGNTGITPFTFTVTRTGDTSGSNSVSWATAAADAGASANASDFFGGTFPSGTLTFAPGETARIVTVNVAGDAVYESAGQPENFTVTLSNATGGAVIATPTATGRIQDDDVVPINGTARDDALNGTSANDHIHGLGGDDTLTGGPGNDTLEGGAGLDTAMYAGSHSLFVVTRTDTGYTLQDSSSATGLDALIEVERARFSDHNLAFDLAPNQAAADTVRIIGAAFDASSIIPPYVGIGLDLFDAGVSTLSVCEMVTRVMGLSNTAFVNTVYQNVVGAAPSPAELAFFVGLLEGSGGPLTQGQLLEIAANAPLNEVNIDLVGLQQTGVEFV